MLWLFGWEHPHNAYTASCSAKSLSVNLCCGVSGLHRNERIKNGLIVDLGGYAAHESMNAEREREREREREKRQPRVPRYKNGTLNNYL